MKMYFVLNQDLLKRTFLQQVIFELYWENFSTCWRTGGRIYNAISVFDGSGRYKLHYTSARSNLSETYCSLELLRYGGIPVQFLSHLIFPGPHFWRARRAQVSLPRGTLRTAGEAGKFLPPMSRCSLRTAEGSTTYLRHSLQIIIQTTLSVCVYTWGQEVTADGKFTPCEAPILVWWLVKQQKRTSYLLRWPKLRKKQLYSNLGLLILWKVSDLQLPEGTNNGKCIHERQYSMLHLRNLWM